MSCGGNLVGNVEGEPGHELPELLLAGVVTHRAQAAENVFRFNQLSKKPYLNHFEVKEEKFQDSPSEVILGQEAVALGVVKTEGILKHGDVQHLACKFSFQNYSSIFTFPWSVRHRILRFI